MNNPTKKTTSYILFFILLSLYGCKKDNTQIDANKPTGLSSDLPPIYYLVPPASIPFAGGPLPDSYELEMPPVGDQGNQGSCVGWAVGYALKGFQRKNEFGLSYTNSGSVNYKAVCSPAYIYNQAKQPGDCLVGTYITDALQLVVNQGVCSWEQMPYSSSNCSATPTTTQKNQAVDNKALLWGTVNITVDAIQNSIYNQLPVVVGLHIDKNFFMPTPVGGEYLWSSTDYSIDGYHAVTITGWDNDKQAFKVYNSWGSNWADNGYIWMSYSILSQVCYQAYTAFNDNGTNTNGPVISVNSQLDFGNVPSGGTKTLTLKVNNTGNAPLNVQGISIAPAGTPYSFTVPTTPFEIAVGGSEDLTISFSPTAVQTYSASLVINSNAVSGQGIVLLSGTGTGGGGGGACNSGNWGTIVVNNTYGDDVRVYIDQSNPNSSNYDLLVPAGQSAPKYLLAPGKHSFLVRNTFSTDLDKGEVYIDKACDSTYIGQNTNSLPTSCSGNNWGIIKVVNGYGDDIRVYLDQSNPNSSNYDLYVPSGQTRYLFSKSIGTHDYLVRNTFSTDLDKAQVHINASCAVGLISNSIPQNASGSSSATGCQSSNWGVIKVVNSYGDDVRVYIDQSSPNSGNYNMYIPAGQTRYFYHASVGSHDFLIRNTFSTDLDKAQIYISNSCDTSSIGSSTGTGGSTPTGCSGGNWGVLKVINNYGEDVRVYVDQTSPNSSNYNMYIPEGSIRYLYQQNVGVHTFLVRNTFSTDVKLGQFPINSACEIYPVTIP